MEQNKKDTEQITTSYLSILKKNKWEKKGNIEMNIVYPQIIKMKNKKIQQEINKLIIDRTYKFMPKNKYKKFNYYANYEITHFINNTLSIKFYESYYTVENKRSNNFISSLTVNVRDGTIYELKDLFNCESTYRSNFTELIKKQIGTNNIFSDKFNTFKEECEYYLTENELVVYHQSDLGIDFALPIPFSILSDILSQKL